MGPAAAHRLGKQTGRLRATTGHACRRMPAFGYAFAMCPIRSAGCRLHPAEPAKLAGSEASPVGLAGIWWVVTSGSHDPYPRADTLPNGISEKHAAPGTHPRRMDGTAAAETRMAHGAAPGRNARQSGDGVPATVVNNIPRSTE